MWMPFLLTFIAIQLIFIASQLFWFRRLRELGERLMADKPWRRWLGAAGVVVYLSLLAYNFTKIWRAPTPVHLTLKAALLEAPFWWWCTSSLVGFALAIIFGVADRAARGLAWAYRIALKGGTAAATARPFTGGRGAPLQDHALPERRRFLEQTALAVCSAPFVAGAYGLLYGRLNLETSHRRIKLPRLPKAFEGFRIAQLSDFHIGAFMTAEEIGNYVAIANELKPDLVLLTGDYITWDRMTQGAVVKSLAGLKAPFGVFGCLGNHEIYTETQDSITRLFAAEGIRILRRECAVLRATGEALNLIGVDFQSRGALGRSGYTGVVGEYLAGVNQLMMPGTVNILLSHNPNSFDRAAELGIDLSLAGHTHGGQVTLEFIHPSLSPSRLITQYVSGWFEKPGGQLYVNRGIGTIGVPIRINARPEITLFELTRA